MTTTPRSVRPAVRALVGGVALLVLSVGAAACVASDNGGVIQGPATTLPGATQPTTPGATTATTAAGATTATTPLGTLPGG